VSDPASLPVSATVPPGAWLTVASPLLVEKEADGSSMKVPSLKRPMAQTGVLVPRGTVSCGTSLGWIWMVTREAVGVGVQVAVAVRVLATGPPQAV
jgi:hypothetical protein